MRGWPTADSRCKLTNESEQQLTSKLLGGFVAGLVVTGIGLLLGLGRVVAGCVDELG